MNKNVAVLLGIAAAVLAFGAGTYLFQPQTTPAVIPPARPGEKTPETKPVSDPAPPPARRGPSAGPRANAPNESQEINGVRARVQSARVHDGILTVNLRLDCVEKRPEFTWKFDYRSASTTFCWDDRGNEYAGSSGDYPTTYYLRAGSGNQMELHFRAPLLKAEYLDMDYPAPFVLPGKVYRFRIPFEMVEFPK